MAFRERGRGVTRRRLGRRRLALAWVVCAIFLPGGALSQGAGGGAEEASSEGEELASPALEASVTVHLAHVEQEVAIERGADGSFRFVLRLDDGGRLILDPNEFARRVYEEQVGRPWWKRLFNITSLAGVLWVALGFLGQAVFTARMLVQWIVSERQQRSTVPIAFWWLSLVGASMLLVYFVWRRDIVGVVGQATGWTIYLRNLWLLRGEQE